MAACFVTSWKAMIAPGGTPSNGTGATEPAGRPPKGSISFVSRMARRPRRRNWFWWDANRPSAMGLGFLQVFHADRSPLHDQEQREPSAKRCRKEVVRAHVFPRRIAELLIEL